MFNAVSLNTCICWSRDTQGVGVSGGRYRHLVQIHESQNENDAMDKLTKQYNTLQNMIYFDERHRLFPTYEFIVSRYRRNSDKATSVQRDRVDIPFQVRPTNGNGNVIAVVNETRKPAPEMNVEQLLRTIRLVSVPLIDPTVREMCKRLRNLTQANSTFVVLVSDTDIKNWCGALNPYIVPIENEVQQIVQPSATYRTINQNGPSVNSSDTNGSTNSQRGDDNTNRDDERNTTDCSNEPIYDILPETKPIPLNNTGLRDSCELIKTMINESISTTCFPSTEPMERQQPNEIEGFNHDNRPTVHGTNTLQHRLL